MGSYLSKPKLEKFSEDFECNGKYECGLSGMQGWRSSMEDSHNCIPKLTENSGFFAVYDGHGGSEVATFCAMHFPTMLKESPEYQKKDYEEALRKTFLNIDAQILEPAAQKELKILTTYEPSGKLPSEADLKKLEAEQSLNEDDEEEEARLLQEEAHMNIEDVLKRYQQENLVAGTIKNEEKPSGSSGSSASPGKSSSGSSAVKGEENEVGSGEQVESEKSEEKEPEEVKSDENNVEMKEEEQKEEMKKETEEVEGSETIKSVDNSGDNNGEVAKKNEEETSKSSNGESAEASSSSSNTQLKKLVKMKTPKRAQKGSLQGINDDDPDDEDFLSDDSEMDDDDDDSDDDDDDSEIDDDIDGEDAANVNASLFEYLKNQPQQSMIEVPGIDSGTTACVALLCDKKLYVANAGDSRCVISRSGGVVHEMSEDHKPEDEIELNRIRKAGGHVNEQGRVNGGLNLSRAIGDHCYKKNKELSLEEQMISSLPDIRCVDLQSDDEFMVIACDGIWNVMTSQEVVDFVRQRLMSKDEEPKQKISEICEQLFEKCIAPDTMGDGTGCDNMTAVIVQFQSSWLKSATSANTAEDAACPSTINGVDKTKSPVKTTSSSPLKSSDSEGRKRGCDAAAGEGSTDAKLVKTDL